MNATDTENNLAAQVSPEQMSGALWAHLILNQSNMALMFLGKVPGRGGEQPPVDLQAASMFVDTLEMLQEKTRGNLETHEKEVLAQTLTSLRMAFVEVANTAPGTGSSAPAKEPRTPEPETSVEGEPTPEGAPPDSEVSRKKFSKKY